MASMMVITRPSQRTLHAVSAELCVPLRSDAIQPAPAASHEPASRELMDESVERAVAQLASIYPEARAPCLVGARVVLDQILACSLDHPGPCCCVDDLSGRVSVSDPGGAVI